VHKLFIKTQNKTRAITTLQTSDGENAAEIKEKREKRAFLWPRILFMVWDTDSDGSATSWFSPWFRQG